MATKEYILSTLRDHRSEISGFGIHSVGLFGSHVRNEQSDKSDIDLLIDFQPGKESFDNLMSAYDYFESLFAHYKLDIVTRNGLSPYFGPYILNEVIYM